MSPAIEVRQPATQTLPLVFDSPHSWLGLPPDFRPLVPEIEIRRSGDAFVDELYGHVVTQGAPLLAARFPRAYIDVNRALEDMDPDMLDSDWPWPTRGGRKIERGIGLVWRRLRDGRQIQPEPLALSEVLGRVESCWRPYHAALEGLIEETHARLGRVLHINCHSMTARGHATTEDGPVARPDVILGDHEGASAAPAITARVAEMLKALGLSVAINRPYKGQELTRCFADPARGRHSLQIELNRGLYLDEESVEKTAGFPLLQERLRRFTQDLAAAL